MRTDRQSRHLSKAASTLSTPGLVWDWLSHGISIPYGRLVVPGDLATVVLSDTGRDHMFRISTVDTNRERRLVVEGTLVFPWVEELRRTWGDAGDTLEGRNLVIDLTNATMIDREGEAAIFELMQEGAKFRCSGVLTKHVLKQLAHKCHAGERDVLRRQDRGNEGEEW